MMLGVIFSRVSSLGKIFLYLIAVVVGGALAAPQAWELIHRLSPDLFGGFLGKIQGMPFHRYLSRSIQIAALVLLLPLLKSLKIRSLRAFSLVPDPWPIRDLGIGMAAGLLCMALIVPLFLGFGACSLASDWSATLVQALPRVAATAVAVALVEEFLFRGVLLGLLRQVMVPPAAVFLAAIPFAILHFFNLPRGGLGEGESVIWWSGLSSLVLAAGSLPPWPLLLWGMTTLFVAGLILGWLTVRTGSLHAAIGLHGVWILGQQLFNKVSVFQPGLVDLLPFVGPSQCSGAVPTGLIPLGALLLGGFLAAILLRRRPLGSCLSNR
jgi:membrane protease YdiL (CAAX protease family)